MVNGRRSTSPGDSDKIVAGLADDSLSYQVLTLRG
jgi:hypothetical protein